MNKPLTDQTPYEIDTQLARLAREHQRATTELNRINDLFRKNKVNPGQEPRTRERMQHLDRTLDDLNMQITALDVEYERRGGWNRVFIVVGGHIHSSTACRNGYNATTDWRWVPGQSGRAWDDIMADAGERMCSWCFPTAPTAYRERPSSIEHPVETEQRHAAQVRANQRAEKQRAADAKKVYDPATGKQVTRFDGELINTERTCKSEIVDVLFWARIARAQRQTERAERMQAHAVWLASALAAKQGKDADALLAACDKKSRQ